MDNLPHAEVLPEPPPLPPRRLTLKGALEWLALVTTIFAGLIAIVGIWVWIDEKSDRDDERAARREERAARAADSELRRISMIGEAQRAISLAASDGKFDSKENSLIEWAFTTLSRENLPIEITADEVIIAETELNCVTLRIRSKRTEFNDVALRHSVVQIETHPAEELRFRDISILGSNIHNQVLRDGEPGGLPLIMFLGGEVEDMDLSQLRSYDYDELGMPDEPGIHYEDDRTNVAFAYTRLRSSRVMSGLNWTKVPLVGADARLEIRWDKICEHSLTDRDECKPVGSDIGPRKGVRTLRVGGVEPACDRPRRDGGPTFVFEVPG